MSVPSRARPASRALACAAALIVASTALTACSPDTAKDAAPSPDSSHAASASPAPTADSGLPTDALPEVPREGITDCPYLDTQFVAESNGQKVTAVDTDTRFDTPACVYWSYPEEPQLQVIVRHAATPEEARAVVDWAAPIDLTDPAEEPAGWSGGRAGGGVIPGRSGAVYAVAKDSTAVVVLTNQKESVKAQLIAEKSIANLGL